MRHSAPRENKNRSALIIAMTLCSRKEKRRIEIAARKRSRRVVAAVVVVGEMSRVPSLYCPELHDGLHILGVLYSKGYLIIWPRLSLSNIIYVAVQEYLFVTVLHVLHDRWSRLFALCIIHLRRPATPTNTLRRR